MTAKQRAARAKFKAVVAEAKKLRKKNPKLTQAQAVKQAFAISYSKAGKKKVGQTHKDTKSHNVSVRVVSGTKKPKIKNVDRRINGYVATFRKGKNTTVHYTRISGYKDQPEIVVGKVGAVTSLKELAPEVKVRLTRGKRVSSLKITGSESAVEILKKFITRICCCYIFK
jgi:hypothetical protein